MGEAVITLLKEFTNEEHIATDMNLQEDLGMDSLKLISLLLLIEDTFNIRLNESDMNPFDLICVADVISIVKRYNER